MERLASLREQSAVSSLLTNLSRNPQPVRPTRNGSAGGSDLSLRRAARHHGPLPRTVRRHPLFRIKRTADYLALAEGMDKREKVNLQQFYPAVRCACSLSFMSFGFSTALPGSWATFFYMGDYYYAFHQSYSAMTIAWSLGVDEKFYLLWPFFLTRIERPKLIKILCGILIAEPVYRSFLTFIGHQPYTWFAFDCRLHAVVLGCLVAWLAKDGWTPPQWILHPFTPACALIMVFALQNDIARVCARSRSSVDGGAAHLIPEKSSLALSQSHLLLPLPLPCSRWRDSVAADCLNIPFAKLHCRVRRANILCDRGCIAAAFPSRVSVPQSERPVAQSTTDGWPTQARFRCLAEREMEKQRSPFV